MTDTSQRICGSVILAIGVLLLLQTLDLISWNIWEFLGPVLLIIWGIAMIRRPERFCGCCFAPPRSESRAQ